MVNCVINDMQKHLYRLEAELAEIKRLLRERESKVSLELRRILVFL